MEKIIEGHLVGFGSVRDMERLEDDYYGEFTDAGMTELLFKDKLSATEYDRICAELSGEVAIKRTKPSE